MISVGGQLSCENQWRYRLLCFWRLLPDSLFDHSWIRMTIMIFQPRASNNTGIAASIVTTDLFPTFRELPLFVETNPLFGAVCAENPIRVDDVTESLKLAE
jgi:hypothetical protein